MTKRNTTNRFKTYYQLTKPGIIYGNILAATAGFLLASKGHIHVWLLLEMLTGTSLVIGSACVFNNYIDQDIDSKMARTKKRALVQGVISNQAALIYATVLALLGFGILSRWTNLLTVYVGLVGFWAYIVLYGVSKRRTVFSTLIGSISGATPPVAGYIAVTNHFDMAALLLFLILVCWQMPHFYAIAMYRSKDYKAAKLPVLPVKKGAEQTKFQMLFYITAFIVACVWLSLRGYTGATFALVMLGVGLTWLWKAIKGFTAKSDAPWARNMFFFSLVVIMSLSIMLSLNHFLP